MVLLSIGSTFLNLTLTRYGVIFLGTIPVKEALFLQNLPSRMGRKALIAKFVFNGIPFVAVTSHFESHDENIPTRTRQIELVYQVQSIIDSFFRY